MTTDAARVAAARRWFRTLGHAPVEADGVTIVATPERPLVWDANFAAAARGVGADAVFAALERHFAAARSQVVQTDCLTDPVVEAALALAGFEQRMTLIEMAAREVSAAHPLPTITLTPVDDVSWPLFAALSDADHREGRRTGGYDAALAAGMLEGMRRRIGPCDYWLVLRDGEPAGYGMTARCPNGLGLIENLFTRPARRGQGLMSAFIVEARRRLRAAGCDAVFLDAHAHDTPKRLYQRLGFAPVALTRTWVKENRP